VLLGGWTAIGHAFSRVVHQEHVGLAVVGPGALYLTAIFNSVTVSHYWVDQHLWRMASAERRQWFVSYFPFLKRTA
jgi:hypothetical protein